MYCKAQRKGRRNMLTHTEALKLLTDISKAIDEMNEIWDQAINHIENDLNKAA